VSTDCEANALTTRPRAGLLIIIFPLQIHVAFVVGKISLNHIVAKY